MLRQEKCSRIVLLGCMLFALFIVGCGSSQSESPPIKIIVNGEVVPSDVSAEVINNKAMVPVNIVADYLGMDVNYDADANQVSISQADHHLQVIVNGKAYTNGNEIAINPPATMAADGQVLIPLDLVGEVFGAKVEWDKSTRTISIDAKTDMVKQSFPANGTIVRYNQSTGVSPLKITTSSGSSQYYVKIAEWDSKKPVLAVYIHSGQTVELEVPEGSYEIKYAAGETWYGEKYLFGPKTVYTKADKKFDFTRTLGHRIELIYQTNGNLGTVPIKRSDF